MADLVIAAVRGEPAARSICSSPSHRECGALDGVIFSGGVAEYVYGTETRDFGDLGRRLGLALADTHRADLLPAPLLPAAERIRATVLGASEYTVQLSGITSFIPTPQPRCHAAISRWPGPHYVLDDDVHPEAVGSAIEHHLSAFGLHDSRRRHRGGIGVQRNAQLPAVARLRRRHHRGYAAIGWQTGGPCI